MTATDSDVKDHEGLLEQYKLYVEMADRVSTRRGQTNIFYISLLSGGLALVSLIVGKNILSGSQSAVLLAIAIMGLILCSLWFVNIRSYKQLNSGKFKVIHEMEQQLPFPCYQREWEFLCKGEESKTYLPLTHIEEFVPFVLTIPYLILGVYAVFGWLR